ncbi:MAG TPA: hypothetical protein VGI99_06020 [Gemmataceae bacterium]|jgi:hypothetical protein
MQGVVALLVCCFVLILALPGLLFLYTYIFRQACSLSGLPKPSVLVATLHLLLISLAQFMTDFAMVESVEWGCDRGGIPQWEARIIIFFLLLPIDLVISSGIHAGLMGIKFGKGIEVWFAQRLIYLSIAAAIAFVAAIVFLARAN